MGRHHYQRFATSSVLAGVLILLISLGGGWGNVYGQTAGPTPTPSRGAVLSVTKRVDNANPRRGDTITFTIRVQNTGSVTARNVIIRDVVPGTFDILNASATLGAVKINGQTISLIIPALDPGVTVLLVVEARVRNNAQGELRNTVIVREGDPSVADGNEQRATAVLMVAEGTAGPTQPGGPRNQIGPSDSLLGRTGAGSGLQLPLLLIGLALVLAGAFVFIRARGTTT